ncbi:MAG: hypothetical protein M3070_14030 [Actinomycetota bacterium]|nr:hypothetical protein [Actinomycetota bacterium]
MSIWSGVGRSVAVWDGPSGLAQAVGASACGLPVQLLILDAAMPAGSAYPIPLVWVDPASTSPTTAPSAAISGPPLLPGVDRGVGLDEAAADGAVDRYAPVQAADVTLRQRDRVAVRESDRRRRIADGRQLRTEPERLAGQWTGWADERQIMRTVNADHRAGCTLATAMRLTTTD